MVPAPAAGYSLVEIVVAAAVLAVGLAVTVPTLSRAADAAEAVAAARHVAGLVARARFEAARRHRTVAVRFDHAADPAFALVVDGDGDGVSAADVEDGIDVVIRPADRLSDHFRGARFRIAGALAGVDGDGMLGPGEAPIRLGTSRQVSVSPLGTATSGTLYIAGRGRTQLAIRIGGVTGRVRVLRYDFGAGRWRPA